VILDPRRKAITTETCEGQYSESSSEKTMDFAHDVHLLRQMIIVIKAVSPTTHPCALFNALKSHE
jgi:hypothetical protein